jgi:hypothetical protein
MPLSLKAVPTSANGPFEPSFGVTALPAEPGSVVFGADDAEAGDIEGTFCARDMDGAMAVARLHKAVAM